VGIVCYPKTWVLGTALLQNCVIWGRSANFSCLKLIYFPWIINTCSAYLTGMLGESNEVTEVKRLKCYMKNILYSSRNTPEYFALFIVKVASILF
jgi:hypothetical protein